MPIVTRMVLLDGPLGQPALELWSLAPATEADMQRITVTATRFGLPATYPRLDEVIACRGCGCTDDRACITPSGPCWWVDDDLCSACAGDADV